MPRYVRNFWITLDVDGAKTSVDTGPRAADGGFQLQIKMRDKGGVTHALKVIGTEVEGDLRLEVLDGADTIRHEHTTTR